MSVLESEANEDFLVVRQMPDPKQLPLDLCGKGSCQGVGAPDLPRTPQ